MGKFKVKNLVFEGEFEVPLREYSSKKVTEVNFDLKGTDEELTEMLEVLQEKLLNNKKFFRDITLYNAVKYANESIFNEDLIDVMCLGERDETFSSSNMQALEDYATSINIHAGYENYEGDVEAFVRKTFGNIDLGYITSDFTISSILLYEDGSFYFAPEPGEDYYDEDDGSIEPNLGGEVWQGDYVEYDAKLIGGVKSH